MATNLAYMTLDKSLRSRRRPPSEEECRRIHWLAHLQEPARSRAAAALQLGVLQTDEYVCRMGRPPSYWFGVVDGLLKISSDAADGTTVTYTGLASGAWFGEGTLLKREVCRYNVQALRRTVVAGLPIETFHWLVENSLEFNRFLLAQINERLGQFMAAKDTDRLHNPEMRVARTLYSLFNPVLVPEAERFLMITQQEMAYLVGISRQRVNASLQQLARKGLIRVEFGGVNVLDLAGLGALAWAGVDEKADAAPARRPAA